MSQPSASASPKPAAGPFTAAITGWGRARSSRIRLDMCCWLARRSRGSSLAVVARRRAVPVQVEARAEAAPGAGEDHGADRALGRDPAQLDVQRLAQLGGHRVQLLGAVENQATNVRRGLLDEQRGGHRRVLGAAPRIRIRIRALTCAYRFETRLAPTARAGPIRTQRGAAMSDGKAEDGGVTRLSFIKTTTGVAAGVGAAAIGVPGAAAATDKERGRSDGAPALRHRPSRASRTCATPGAAR